MNLHLYVFTYSHRRRAFRRGTKNIVLAKLGTSLE